MISAYEEARLISVNQGLRLPHVDTKFWTRPSLRGLEHMPEDVREAKLRAIHLERKRYEANIVRRLAAMSTTKAVVITRTDSGRDEYDVYRVDGLALTLVEPCICDRDLAESIAADIVSGEETILFQKPVTAVVRSTGGLSFFGEE